MLDNAPVEVGMHMCRIMHRLRWGMDPHVPDNTMAEVGMHMFLIMHQLWWACTCRVSFSHLGWAGGGGGGGGLATSLGTFPPPPPPPLKIVLLKFIIDVDKCLTKCMSNESMHM